MKTFLANIGADNTLCSCIDKSNEALSAVMVAFKHTHNIEFNKRNLEYLQLMDLQSTYSTAIALQGTVPGVNISTMHDEIIISVNSDKLADKSFNPNKLRYLADRTKYFKIYLDKFVKSYKVDPYTRWEEYNPFLVETLLTRNRLDILTYFSEQNRKIDVSHSVLALLTTDLLDTYIQLGLSYEELEIIADTLLHTNKFDLRGAVDKFAWVFLEVASYKV